MIFHVAYSAEARQDLRDIYEYIAYELLVPETAAGRAESDREKGGCFL